MVERYYFISDQAYGPAFLMRPVVVLVLLGAAWVIFGPMLRALLQRRPAGASRKAFRFGLDLRFDQHVLFTAALIAIAIAAILTSLQWQFAARLMPLTAAIAALTFGCLALAEQFLGIEIPHEPAGALSSGKLVPQKFDRIFGLRAFRFFLWFAGTLAVAALVGLLPALFVMLLLIMHFEFGESIVVALIVAGTMTLAQWSVFGWLFETPWPLALLGDYLPRLRSITALF
jgi:putative tricarboxylic transport membrane protein